MAETLGTISAVSAMGTLKASSAIYELVQTIKDAPPEIRALQRDIEGFRTLVENLNTALESANVDKVVKEDDQLYRALKTLQYPMKDCENTCSEILEKLKGSGITGTSGDPNQPLLSRHYDRHMKWNFTRKEVYTMITRFQATKGVFSHAMASLTLYD